MTGTGPSPGGERPARHLRPDAPETPTDAAPPAPTVALVTWDDDPPAGGQGVYARDLRHALEARGVPVRTVAGHGPHAMPYRRITGRGHLDMTLALALSTRPIRADAPEVVHVSGGPGGLFLTRDVHAPVVYTAHHTYRQAHRSGPARWYGVVEARCYRRARMVTAPSPSTADAVLAMGVHHSRVTVISPGVHADEAVSDGARVPGRMLFLGRLEDEKGPLDAVAVMQAVAAAHPGAHGHVVGDGRRAAAVADACRASGGHVTFRGRLGDEEVDRELREAQVVLMPSAYEGLGFVALEAMGRGAVVIGYDVAGLHDTIGARGVLVDRGDIAAMSRRCADLLADDGARSRLAEAALSSVRAERSWDRCAQEYVGVYRSVAGG